MKKTILLLASIIFSLISCSTMVHTIKEYDCSSLYSRYNKLLDFQIRSALENDREIVYARHLIVDHNCLSEDDMLATVDVFFASILDTTVKGKYWCFAIQLEAMVREIDEITIDSTVRTVQILKANTCTKEDFLPQ